MTVPNQRDLLIEQLLALPDAAARQALLAQSEATGDFKELLEAIAARVDFCCRSNPAQALELSDLALSLAGDSENNLAAGLAQRARANALRAVGNYQETLPYYQKAIECFKRAGAAAEEGRTYLGELAALSNLGRFAECLQSGAAIRRRLSRLGDTLNLAKICSTLAIVNHQTGNYDSSLRLHNRSLQLFKSLGLNDMLAPGLVNRANTLTQLNRFRQAAQDYETCRADFAARGMTALVAVIDANLGFLLFRQGRYNEALSLLNAAREGFEATEQADKRALAELDLAFCYSALSLYDEALAFYEMAGKTFETLQMQYEALRVEIGRAEVLLLKGETRYAAERLQAVLDSYDTATESEQNRHALAIVWLYLAQLKLKENPQQPDTALELCRKAQAVFSELKLPYWYAQSLITEADLLRLAERWQEANLIYEKALSPVNRLKLPHQLYQLHYGWGALQQALPSQNGEGQRAAREHFLLAAEQVESIRALLRPEELRVAFMENGLNVYERLVELCLQDTGNPQVVEEAFVYVERSKSRALLDQLSRELSGGEASANPQHSELLERIQKLRGELNWFYSQVHLQTPHSSSSTQRSGEFEIEKVAHQLETRERELTALLRRYASYNQPSLPLAKKNLNQSQALAKHIAGLLQPDQTLLEYFALDNRLMAFVLTKNSLEIFPDLCKLSEVEILQERLNFQADKFNLGRPYVERHLESLRQNFDLYLKKLYQLLIAPLRQSLATEKLLVVPHGKLHSLPFHALHSGESYLTEQYEIAYAPSAEILRHCLEQPERPANKLLALAVPDEFLPGVAAEVRNIAPLFPDRRVLVGAEASFTNLQANIGWCDILHLASHGVFREDNPLFSLLKLSDSWLSVYDIANWRFKPSLVTLSACQSGLNRSIRGDELLGLARGFFTAGTSSLVASLWPVSDDVTALLMQKFYTSLAGGAKRSEALRAAMLEVKAQERFSHPHYWAPFVLIGRP
ncbi:MAG TPA: CHAT domain-containing tetratricopeptide repeat protein [Chloroflexia bacterium]|nr:CHAT domain-containing tetratricopeptide repeat protein [Chloroflexia bacterium]